MSARRTSCSHRAACPPGLEHPSALITGLFIVACAAFIGGVTGFGYALVATPLLVVSGFSLPFVITTNFMVSLLTRISVAYRLREHVRWRASGLLVAGSVPGLLLGARLVTWLDPAALRIAVGALVAFAGIATARRATTAPAGLFRGAAAIAGFAGGVIGGMSSLTGIAPVLLLTGQRVKARPFLATLAVYFVASSAIALAILRQAGVVETSGLFPDIAVWLPAALAGNAVGVAFAQRISVAAFQRTTLVLVVAAGIATIVTARSW